MALHLKNVFSSFTSKAPAHPKKIVGIDFASSSVKTVEIELRDNVLTLNTYGELQLGPYGEVDLGNSVELTLQKKVEALVDVLRETGISTKSGVLSLPLSESFVTVIDLAANAKEDIATRVPIEARKYIPVPMADVSLEWTEIPEAVELQETREILLAAIQNEPLKDMHSLMDAVQMTSQPSEIELFSTLRSLTKATDSSLAVIDIGATTSKLYISQDGYLRRLHRVITGGANATSAIAKALNIPFEDAENTKRNYTPNSEHAADIKRLMSVTFDRSFQEFKRVINQFEARTGTQIARTIITGGGALFYDFIPYAQYQLDRSVELANPFTKVAYPAFMEDTMKEVGPVFAVALGAALRPFEQ